MTLNAHSNKKLTQREKVSLGIGTGFIVLAFVANLLIQCPSNSFYVTLRSLFSLGFLLAAIGAEGYFDLKIYRLKSIKIVGPIGLAIVIYLFTPRILSQSDRCTETIDFTIYLRDINENTPLLNEAKLTLTYGGNNPEYQVTNGACTFKEIPSFYLDSNLDLQISATGWVFTNGKKATLVKIHGHSSKQIIQKDDAFCCVQGFVKDDKRFLSGVQVRIKDIIDTTDEHGRYYLRIPPEKQEPFYTIIAYKKGYAFRTYNNIPAATSEEQPITLIRISK